MCCFTPLIPIDPSATVCVIIMVCVKLIWAQVVYSHFVYYEMGIPYNSELPCHSNLSTTLIRNYYFRSILSACSIY